MRFSGFLFAGLSLLLGASAVSALGPEDVWIVVNKNVPDSQGIADYYCEKRGVPKDHVVVLDLPSTEDVSRDSYNDKIAGPLRAQLKDKRDKVKVLLTVYGVPLRVGPEEPSPDDKAALEKLKEPIASMEANRKELSDVIKALDDKARDDPKGEAVKEAAERRKERAEFERQWERLDQKRRYLSHSESQAAVDSELALLWQEPYELRRWQMNLLYWQVPEAARKGAPPVVMTCRLDGPTPALVKKIIDQSIAVEAKGLEGKVYVDARGIKYNPADEPGFGYGGYDESMREMARLLEKDGKMAVTLDDKPELFAPGSCPDCALYCGWYSHAIYVDCCKFAPGAVAWHLASSEAVSLRDPKCKFWCKNLLENGVVATLGPVAEPYTVGFPKPAEFFGFLATGEYTLVETYWRTEMFASWMTVLVGDPLYNPYAKAPKLKSEQVKPSPAGGRFPLIKDEK